LQVEIAQLRGNLVGGATPEEVAKLADSLEEIKNSLK